MTPAAGTTPSVDFATVEAAERAWIERRRASAGLEPRREGSVGLGLSGGGIRSATFNLGVIEALHGAGLMRDVDYLSTVSGGGYVGACYSWLRASRPDDGANPFEEPLPGGGRVIDWLRRHGRYLVAARGYSLWTLGASIFAATFLNLLVLGPVVLLAVYAMTLGWLPLGWPPGLAGLPDPDPRHHHHGYLLLLGLGAACLAVFPLTALGFGVAAGIRERASMRRIDMLRILMGRQLAVGLALLAVGLIPVVHAFWDQFSTRFESSMMHVLGQHMSYLLPLLSGLAALLAGRGGRTPWRMQVGSTGLALVIYGLLVLAYHLVVHVDFVGTPLFWALAVLAALLASHLNVNRISMHGYYRARLSEAFMPIPTAARHVHPMEFRLDQLDPERGAPLHLVNTTLNTSTSPDQRRHGREGASYVLSPLYCGSLATGYTRCDGFAGGGMALSTAFTISGAAIDPDNAGVGSRAVSSLMALLNVRLGYWADNPSRPRGRLSGEWWWLIGREMLGVGLDERHARIHLSDGGHFENLGLYELVRRKVRHIIVCDAGADPDLDLADLGRAIERVRVDFGAEVRLSADRLVAEHASGAATRPFLLGEVLYADGSRGRIVYIKPMRIAEAPADLYAYARANPSFPNQPTSNQFFGETEFEAYRTLGRCLVERMLADAGAVGVAGWFDRLWAAGAEERARSE